MTQAEPAQAVGIEHHLSVHPFLRGIDDDALADLAGCAELITYTAGEPVIKVGDPAGHFYLVRTGMIAVEVPTDPHNERTIQRLYEGDALGWSWLFPPFEWQFDAHARTKVQAIALSADCLRELFTRNHELGYEFTRRMAGIIADRLHAARHQIGELSRA